MNSFCNLYRVLFLENGIRFLKIDKTFFTGYRQNALHPDEIVIDLFIPFTQKVRVWYTFLMK